MMLPLQLHKKNERLEKYLTILRAHKSEITHEGDILEVLVRDHLERTLPKYLGVDGNIKYYVGHKLTGELDVVIYSKGMFRPVVAVEEIKCWRNQRKALAKAKMQLDRFNTSLLSNRITKFVGGDGNNKKYTNINFIRGFQLLTRGAKNATLVGFDFEFNLTPKEKDYLFDKVKNEM
jgi:hypothetical protein